jgi:hypothetical protein
VPLAVQSLAPGLTLMQPPRWKMRESEEGRFGREGASWAGLPMCPAMSAVGLGLAHA